MKFKHFFKIGLVVLTMVMATGCEKQLDYVTYDQFSETTFFTNASDAKAGVTYIYTGLGAGQSWSGGYGSAAESWTVQSDLIGSQLVCDWGNQTGPNDFWGRFMQINLDPANANEIFQAYNKLMPIISSATVYMSKISAIKMDETLKKRYIAEIKAVRAHLSWILFNLYGPVPVRLDATEAQNPKALPIPRPTNAEMVANIEKDYNEALVDLPTTYSDADKGRMTQGACLMGLLKLYMHEKNWPKAIVAGNAIKNLAATGVYGLVPDYKDIFTYENQNNYELIMSIPTNKTNWTISNYWLAHCLPASPEYVSPTGQSLTQWGGYKMPWRNYDKFNPTDKRLKVLLRKYPIDAAGTLWDAKTGGVVGSTNYAPKSGAIPMKYGPDPTSPGEQQGVNIVIWRYADALLLLAEAINEQNGPTTEAYDLVGLVRARAGLANIPPGLNKDDFRAKLMDERLFELWAEGTSREDCIRWGTLFTTPRATVTGYTINTRGVLYPIPQKVIDETNNVVKQNPGY